MMVEYNALCPVWALFPAGCFVGLIGTLLFQWISEKLEEN